MKNSIKIVSLFFLSLAFVEAKQEVHYQVITPQEIFEKDTTGTDKKPFVKQSESRKETKRFFKILAVIFGFT